MRDESTSMGVVVEVGASISPPTRVPVRSMLTTWVPWSVGDPAPVPGRYRVIVCAPLDESDRWDALCDVLPADDVRPRRFDWPYSSRVLAYWPEPLAPFAELR